MKINLTHIAIVVILGIIIYFLLKKKKPESAFSLVGVMNKAQKPQTAPPLQPDYTNCMNRYRSALPLANLYKGTQKLQYLNFINASLLTCKSCVTGCYNDYNNAIKSENDVTRAQAPYHLNTCRSWCITGN